MQLSCLFTLSNFLAVPFVSVFLHLSFCRESSARDIQWVRHPPWAQEHKLLLCLPSCFPCGWGWTHWGALLSSPYLTWGRCTSPADIQRVLHKEFTCPDCQVSASVHFPLQSLVSKGFFFNSVFAYQVWTPLMPLLNILAMMHLRATHDCPPSLWGGGGGESGS